VKWISTCERSEIAAIASFANSTKQNKFTIFQHVTTTTMVNSDTWYNTEFHHCCIWLISIVHILPQLTTIHHTMERFTKCDHKYIIRKEQTMVTRCVLKHSQWVKTIRALILAEEGLQFIVALGSEWVAWSYYASLRNKKSITCKIFWKRPT
jgi:hypothetical protein